jgi:hypothetical protein
VQIQEGRESENINAMHIGVRFGLGMEWNGMDSMSDEWYETMMHRRILVRTSTVDAGLDGAWKWS